VFLFVKSAQYVTSAPLAYIQPGAELGRAKPTANIKSLTEAPFFMPPCFLRAGNGENKRANTRQQTPMNGGERFVSFTIGLCPFRRY